MPLLNEEKLTEDYKTSLQSMQGWWENFDEYERIARNKPHPKVIAAKMPTVTDGTLAGVIRSQPKRVVQQIPTGRVTSVDQPDLAPLADYIVENEIIPNADYNGDVITKSWLMISRAATYGCSVSYAFFKQSGDYFGGDFSLPYIKDIIFQRGKSYGPDCKKLWMRQWYTEDDINSIIDKEKRLGRNAKKRGDSYDPTWDRAILKEALKFAKKKAVDALTPAEKAKGDQPAVYVQIIHAFEEGVGAKFYSFSPDLPDGKNIVRTKTNPDPTGKMPISFMYMDIDLSNPLGVGYVEMSGALQNLLDSEVQTYQLMQKLMLAPPVMKWGKGIKGATIKWKSNAVWDMGADVNNKIEAVNINNQAIANFVNNYGLIKSQILNLTNNQDASVGTQAAGPASQSKTPAGIAQQNQKIGFDDNFVRKRFEAWFQDNMERVINIHFAETDGQREVELTEDWIEDVYGTLLEQANPQIQQAQQQAQSQQQPSQPGQPGQGGDGDEQQPEDAVTEILDDLDALNSPSELYEVDTKKKIATVLYGQIKSKFRFRVDPSSSESVNDADQVSNLKELITDAAQNPQAMYYLMNDGWQLHLGEAYRDLFMRLGVANISKILTRIPADQRGQGAGIGPMSPFFDKPKVTVPIDRMPVAAQIQALKNAGIDVSADDFGVQTDANGLPVEQTGRSISGTVPGAAQPGAAVPTPSAPGSVGPEPAPAQAAPPIEAHAASRGEHISAPHLAPGDKQLVMEFLQRGYSSRQALAGLLLMHKGYPQEQILQQLGQPQGVPVNG